LSGGLASMFMPKKAAWKIEHMEPITGIPGAKRIKMIHGPYRLKAANVRKTVHEVRSF
jgi:hypothetical protein